MLITPEFYEEKKPLLRSIIGVLPYKYSTRIAKDTRTSVNQVTNFARGNCYNKKIALAVEIEYTTEIKKHLPLIKAKKLI